MSIDDKNLVSLNSQEIVVSSTIPVSSSLTSSVCIEQNDNEITAIKKEYSVVGDGLYASINTEEAPQWLTAIIDDLVGSAVAGSLTDYDLLVQDVRNAIDSIDVAQNTYVQEININSLVNGIVSSRLETLNATFEDTYATQVELNVALATTEESLVLSTTDLIAQFNDSIGSRITGVELSYANADEALAISVNSLNSRINGQDDELQGNAEAITGLKTYVGLNEDNDPDGTGVLSRVQILENQNDGVIVYHTGFYDVMINVADDENSSDDEIDTAQEPYATWLSTDTTNGNDNERRNHISDVFIQYDENSGEYIKSYKFIKIAPDVDPPFATDTEGYTWSLIVDNDTQAAYSLALQAKDLADNKRRVFVAEPVAPYDIGDLWVDDSTTPQTIKVSTVDRTSVFNLNDWVVADQQAQDFIDTVYNPEKIRIENQIDGKIEYTFYDSFTDIIDPLTSNASTSEARSLEILKEAFSTEELKDFANGNVAYFKDSKNAYWYQSKTDLWLSITDTSIYEALEEAVAARGAADGKVSQFYAWDSDTTPTSDFIYWLKSDNNLYYKLSSTWILVPTTVNSSVYVAEGDLLTGYDPITKDYTNYSYNGSSWQISGPSGIISSSTFFVDLANDVRNVDGLVFSALSNLEIQNTAYVDDSVAEVKNNFTYNTTLNINDVYYTTGFGLNTSGVGDLVQPPGADGTSPGTAFDSEFWINAERFVLKSPSFPSVSAVFKVSSGGIVLGIENTEATKNNPRGDYSSSTNYDEGDIVLYEGSSYIALRDTINDTPSTSTNDWQLLAIKGEGGSSSSAIDLIPSTSAIVYDTSGSLETTSIVLDSFARNSQGTLTYQFYVNGTSQGSPSSTDSFTYNPNSSYTSNPISIKVELREDDILTAIDEVTLYPIKSGSDSVTVILSNEAHTLSSNSAGVVSNYAGSGTTIKVYQGSNELTYQSGTGNPTSSSRFKVEVSVSNIVAGSVSGNGTTTATYADASGMSSDNASISFNVIVRNDVDEIVDLPKVQSFSKAKSGENGEDGENGTSGRNNATVYLYIRSGSGTPSIPTTTSTYNFSTRTLTGFNNSWSTTIPSGTDPVYVIGATASSTANTDIINSNEWSSPVVLASNGEDGNNGLNSASVYLYQRSSSSPSVPSNSITYTFSTGATSTANNGWSRDIPTGTDPIYVILGTAVSTTDTDIIASGEWSSPSILAQNGEDGEDGEDGDKGDKGDTGDSGSNGAGLFGNSYSSILWDNTTANSRFNSLVGRNPVNLDLFTQSRSDETDSQTRQYDGSNWVVVPFQFNGSLFVDGTIAGDAIIAGTTINSPVIRGGNIELVGNDFMSVRSATPFGPNNLIEWFGPVSGNVNAGVVDYSGLTKVNGKKWVDSQGNIKTEGVIIAGTLTTSKQSAEITNTPSVEASVGSDGNQIAVNCSIIASFSNGLLSGNCPSTAPSDPTVVLRLYNASTNALLFEESATGSYSCLEEGSEYQDIYQVSASFTYFDNNLNTSTRNFRTEAVISNLPFGSLRTQRISILTQEA